MASDELTRLTAREAVSLLKSGAVSPLELVDAALERIAETDGAINAMPTLCPERARGHAMRLATAGRSISTELRAFGILCSSDSSSGAVLNMRTSCKIKRPRSFTSYSSES